ncbi:MAG: prepilin-type N-terminal cleavage/methylation domain-containing protein [Candidatus Staskawiczbacteria bacterium]|nr:prepilin-type N-terminal cleavage/methylation domain-containing protein [Candidatus Staskawiczbacteria bacterium]
MKNGALTGFTIIELVVVIAIVSILAGILIPNFNNILESARVSTAGSVQRAMTKAVQMYYLDMGFYPPDVVRGWDPGLVSPCTTLSCSNPDGSAHGSYSSPIVTCTDCPSGWETIVATSWHGPYLAQWPLKTPWGGLYDYNYWPAGASRPPCVNNPGVYAGVEGDYDGNHNMPPTAEDKMRAYGFDVPCPNNGEAQMLLQILPCHLNSDCTSGNCTNGLCI